MKKVIFALLIILFGLSFVGCDFNARTDPELKTIINGEYLGDCIYEQPELSSVVLSSYFKIENNTIEDYEFINVEASDEFLNELIFIDKAMINDKIKLYYAEFDSNLDYSYGYYLLATNDEFYLIGTGYSEDSGYSIHRAFKLTRLEDLMTALPLTMPEDFSFSIHWGFDGYYDSATHELKNGYNEDLACVCKTELILTNEELTEIFRLLRSVKIDTIPEGINAGGPDIVPSYINYVKYEINNASKIFYIYNTQDIEIENWSCYKELGYAFDKIVNEYIESSEEYKSLPENQNRYD